MVQSLTPEEWLITIGDDIRERRLDFEGGMTRKELAALAGVSISALANLERGEGATLTTFIRVLRALDCAQWLATLKPSPVLNPMLLLDSGKKRQRARRKS